jgi:hypothetical protein
VNLEQRKWILISKKEMNTKYEFLFLKIVKIGEIKALQIIENNNLLLFVTHYLI